MSAGFFIIVINMLQSNKYVIILVASVIILGLLIGVIINFFSQKNMPETTQDKLEKISEEDIRSPAVAGAFYPGTAGELEEMIDDYLAEVELPELQGVPQVIIVPHAGYVYSGQVAAYGFKTLQNSGFKRAVIIGRSHTAHFSGVAVDTNKVWSTPLGDVRVDQKFIELLEKATPVVTTNEMYHEDEHSLEVEVPFLQRILGEDIKIVPLLFGSEDEQTIQELAKALEKLVDQETVVVISSDLSHYPVYEDANKLDKQVIDAILTGDVEQFTSKVRELENLQTLGVATLACAEPAITTGLILAQTLHLKPHLLKYANSGDYPIGDKYRVVGYGALVFNNPTGENIGGEDMERELNKAEQEMALQIARQALEAAFANYDYKPDVSGYSVFQAKRGVFVTLKKQGELRGCIGSFEPGKSLAEVIKDMALSAAFQDSRFPPLRENELDEIKIEISALSALEKIDNPNVIEVGKHGVQVIKGSRSDVYLPQVAVEQGWDREELLDHLCAEKAGISMDAWRDGSADIYIFTAQVFGEETRK